MEWVLTLSVAQSPVLTIANCVRGVEHLLCLDQLLAGRRLGGGGNRLAVAEFVDVGQHRAGADPSRVVVVDGGGEVLVGGGNVAAGSAGCTSRRSRRPRTVVYVEQVAVVRRLVRMQVRSGPGHQVGGPLLALLQRAGRVVQRSGHLQLGTVVDTFQRLDHGDAVGEHSIGQQKGVEKVDAQKAQIGEPLEEPLGTGVTDLRQLARVQCATEANVDVVFEKARIVSGIDSIRIGPIAALPPT